jgi:galactokinase
MDLAALSKEFLLQFSATPAFYRAPGRVNLIGEHTDYNEGFVMPAAIEFYTTVAIAPQSGRRLRVKSLNLGETCEVALSDLSQMRSPTRNSHWIDYVSGVSRALERHGIALEGADLLIHSEVPIGAGLSSSAALEVAVALALSSLVGLTLDKVTVARLCQEAENDYVGMRCGIMDQFAACCGQADNALTIDCRSLKYELVPLVTRHTDSEAAVQLVICNTMVRHHHAGGEYNRRRAQCEEGLRRLKVYAPEMEALRDASPELLQMHESAFDPVIYRRCRHVVSENERVLKATAALRQGCPEKFGELMGESHQSLRDDYEVSCDELNLMVQLAESIDGVYGARMTGGGFGGCTVNLVRSDAVTHFRSLIAERYARATGYTPEIYVCKAADGAGRVVYPSGLQG